MPNTRKRHLPARATIPTRHARPTSCPRCNAPVHRFDHDDNAGVWHDPKYADPHTLTEPEAIACILAGRPIYTWRTDILRRHHHGAPSRWHPATRHAPQHRCGHAFPETVYEVSEPEPFELIAQHDPTNRTYPF